MWILGGLLRNSGLLYESWFGVGDEVGDDVMNESRGLAENWDINERTLSQDGTVSMIWTKIIQVLGAFTTQTDWDLGSPSIE